MDKSQVYETSFLLLPTIAEENLIAKFGDLKNALEKAGASFISEELPKMRALAYTILQNNAGKNTKFNFAYFAWVKYELSTSKAEEIKQLFEQNKDLLRFLTIKTVRENTLSGYKFAKKDDNKVVGEDKKEGIAVVVTERNEEVTEEVNSEELDQKIDEIVS